MGTIKAKCSMMLRTTGGMLAAGLLAGFCLTIGHVSAAFAAKLRKFYLTPGDFHGNQVLTACSGGYHTAALWEILDVSNLQYDTSRGYTNDDAGSGPPTGSGRHGWIRTGYISDTGSGTPGQANCANWTSASPSDLGTIVRLQYFWDSASMYPINPWVPSTHSCNNSNRVWCIKD